MKTIREQVGGRPLSAVTPEKKEMDTPSRPMVDGNAQLGDAVISAESAMKCIIEVGKILCNALNLPTDCSQNMSFVVEVLKLIEMRCDVDLIPLEFGSVSATPLSNLLQTETYSQLTTVNIDDALKQVLACRKIPTAYDV